MKIIYNKYIPFPGYKAITIWPFILVRESLKSRYGKVDDRHEHIHGEQQKEMPVIFFLWYLVEWLIRLLLYRNQKEAYRNISFEQEAFGHEKETVYLTIRKHYAWMKYLTKKTYNQS